MTVSSDAVLDGPTLLRIERLEIRCDRRSEHRLPPCSIPRSMIPVGTAMSSLSQLTENPNFRLHVGQIIWHIILPPEATALKC